jgi:hypothetical protein
MQVTMAAIDPDVVYRRVSWEARRRINIAKDKQAKTGEDPRKDIVHSLRYLLFALQILDAVRPATLSNHPWARVPSGVRASECRARSPTTAQQTRISRASWPPARMPWSGPTGSVSTTNCKGASPHFSRLGSSIPSTPVARSTGNSLSLPSCRFVAASLRQLLNIPLTAQNGPVESPPSCGQGNWHRCTLL